ncbi:hypothetical protein VOLCADRAFT_104737 [Volvox carteri f. nagariensis]|uniref:Uncharacterized protein n=1 Tax=Volvox carteri f. nagariensis TaxID=3068 RepID=D8TVR4_VOLCA|nr:uncharacterized protein VOLCADRAFT_104737 [Volvox carteri f. nagariensis]EFJ48348.1 hypothetical protein VOLCADRAFT_104737 [Volvox carteri f. nagariensis]|eukprot:XP_002950602.1 hypothetical protein VOLCADRAFT_104737 [Volvox carteri f. nagariensis]
MADPVYPSTMRYRDRLSMANEDVHKYNRLYLTPHESDVWTRLTSDAGLRQSSARSIPPFQEGQAQVNYSFKNSGFDSNTCPAQYTHNSFKQGLYQHGTPIEQQHKITAGRFKRAYPLDFMCQIRPETETTNQAMRMLGTYSSDISHAERIGLFIPQGCPGGKPSYHPDVTTSGYGLAPTLPRRGLSQTLTDGRHLK